MYCLPEFSVEVNTQMKNRHKDILLLYRHFPNLLSIRENSEVKSLIVEGTLGLLKKILPEAQTATDYFYTCVSEIFCLLTLNF